MGDRSKRARRAALRRMAGSASAEILREDHVVPEGATGAYTDADGRTSYTFDERPNEPTSTYTTREGSMSVYPLRFEEGDPTTRRRPQRR